MTVFTLLAAVLVGGFVASGVTFVVRAVTHQVAPSLLLLKPWSCALCMAWWPSLAFGIYFGAASDLASASAVVLGATGFGYLINKVCEFIASRID